MEACSFVMNMNLNKYTRVLWVSKAITMVALMVPFHKSLMLDNMTKEFAAICLKFLSCQ